LERKTCGGGLQVTVGELEERSIGKRSRRNVRPPQPADSSHPGAERDGARGGLEPATRPLGTGCLETCVSYNSTRFPGVAGRRNTEPAHEPWQEESGARVICTSVREIGAGGLHLREDFFGRSSSRRSPAGVSTARRPSRSKQPAADLYLQRFDRVLTADWGDRQLPRVSVKLFSRASVAKVRSFRLVE